MKTPFHIIILLTLTLSACKNETEKGRFKITGQIKNIPDQKIFLEQLYFSQKNPEILDTAEIKNGKFELGAIAQEEGLYRLRLEKLESGFIFINDNPEIKFNADIKDTSLEGPVFNTPANAKLKNLLKNIAAKSKEMEEASLQKDAPDTTGTGNSISHTRLNELGKDFKGFIVKFIDTSSDPIVAMFALGYTRNVDPGQLKRVIPNLVKRFPDHQGVASLVSQYNQLIAEQNNPRPVKTGMPQIGSQAADITMNDINDKPFSLSQLRGKYVLIDFWASWCGPCRGENPNIVAAYNKYKDKNFTVLGVSLDESKDSWINAIKEDGLEWQQISDLKGWSCAAVPLYGFDAIPYNVLIDPEGKIIAASLRDDVLDTKLAEVLE